LPEKGTKMSFSDWDKTIQPAFVLYGDIECVLDDQCDNETLQTHKPIAAAFLIISKLKTNEYNRYFSFKGRDCLIKFMKTLEEEGKTMIKWVEENSHVKINLNEAERSQYINETICYLCSKPVTTTEKCADHDHYSGKFLGAAHKRCNIKRQERRRTIPILFHNLSYDMHHIIKYSLSEFKHWKLNVIAKTSEDYMCLDVYIKIPDKNYSLHFKFLDSYRFLSSSLENLVRINTDFPITYSLGIMQKYRKGVFPYTYVNSEKRLMETNLPAYEDFYDTLAKRIVITQDDYSDAQEAWKIFNCNTLYDYMMVYLKIDVYLLADIFEQFRKLVYNEDKLEATNFISLPGLTWSSSMKFYGKDIELLHDAEMYEMFERGVRGGLTFINTHHATRSSTDDLLYIDANNLYGYALSLKLPISDFKWVDGCDILEKFNDKSINMVLEVDITIPENLMDYCDDLPFAPEKRKIQKQWLTDYMNSENDQFHSTEKLLLTHFKKEKYVVHADILKFYQSQGVIVDTYHRAIEFKEDYVFREYITYNSIKRSNAKNAFTKDYYKLKNNALYGKSVENLRTRIDFRLVNNTNKFNAYTSRPTFTNVKYFAENVVGIQLLKEEVVLDRPIFIGMAVLELSKLFMYQLRYEMLPKYCEEFGGSITVMAMDTDSFFLKVNVNIIQNIFSYIF